MYVPYILEGPGWFSQTEIRSSAERGSLGRCTNQQAGCWCCVYPAWVWSTPIRPNLSSCIMRIIEPVLTHIKSPPTRASFVPFCTYLLVWPPPFQAPAGCLWQMLLHHDSLWGVQEEEKVSRDKSTCFNDVLTPVWISESNNHFIVQDSTRCPTPLASLMAMCGQCTWNTGRWWKTATWQLVRWDYCICRCNFKGYFQTWASSCEQTTSTDWKRKKRSTTRCMRTFRATSSTIYR